MFDLGWCFEHGIGCEKNEKKALELYRKADAFFPDELEEKLSFHEKAEGYWIVTGFNEEFLMKFVVFLG